MARISRVTYENASDEVKQVMDGHKAKGYRITNMKETLLHSIPAFQALEDGVYGMSVHPKRCTHSGRIAG